MRAGSEDGDVSASRIGDSSSLFTVRGGIRGGEAATLTTDVDHPPAV